MAKITALVHTYNAEYYLEECLGALSGLDEILICDMYSTDRTLEIAEKFGARVIMHENVGYADPARDWAIKQAKNEWVLVIDSDEIVTPQLKQFVEEFTIDQTIYRAAQIPIMEYFNGQSLRCYYPNHIIRLMHRDHVYWPATIHSQPQIDGEIYKTPSSRKELAIKHYSNPSVSFRMAKVNIYSDKEVERKRNKKKYASFWMTSFSASFRFFKYYILKGGFLDGRMGLASCMIDAIYKYVVLIKIWEDKQNKS